MMQLPAPIQRPDTTHIDGRIANMTKNLAKTTSPDVLGMVKRIYEQHVQRLEHEMAQDIQAECKRSWVSCLA